MSLNRIVYSVSDVNQYIKTIINNDENLRYINVKGEISNFKYGANGHIYFSLKDSKSIINVCLFSTYASKLTFSPKNGDEVTVLASVDVYPTRGTYQLIAVYVEQFGQGAILVELERLKKQLQSEGLFDASRKRAINIYPKAIGVITAINSAAIKDIITNIKRRYPIADIYIFPSQVQGDNAAKDLLRAFNLSQKYELDTLIIGRGGGASEDLSAFNDEALVRAIASSKMPVIAAVGHEIDSTLVDFVADKRASTPTGAAELATIDRREIYLQFQDAIDQMNTGLREYIQDAKEQLLDLKNDLNNEINDKLFDLKTLIESKKQQLEALSPKNVLNRGYSISVKKNGKIISSVNELTENEDIITIYSDGEIVSTIKEVKK